jgi:endoglucanase
MRWVGVDESVAEFGQGNYPGTWGIDFRFPDETAIGVSFIVYHTTLTYY